MSGCSSGEQQTDVRRDEREHTFTKTSSMCWV
jgi:hypothetical protein